ncbi:MAG: ComEC family competence protein [Chitinophagales bacterium]|nr:ComEC family competence protein [Chitinophagales bacterium]
MRNVWGEMPFVRFALAMMAGVGLEILLDYSMGFADTFFRVFLLAGFSAVALLLLFGRLKPQYLYKWRVWQGAGVNLALVSFAYCWTWIYAAKNHPSHFQNVSYNDSYVVAVIQEPPIAKEKIISTVAEVKTVFGNDTMINTSGKLLINLPKTETTKQLQYGDEVIFRGDIQEFEAPKNPEEFSFKLYQSFHNIYHRVFLQDNTWQLTGRNLGNPVFTAVYAVRNNFLKKIEHYVTEPNNLAVASAIMLGYRDYMNADVVRAYSGSGALHVLSVSGLHVGIVFLMLNFMLKWMDKRGRKIQITKSVLIILLIWFYALLTGMCPSVLRSATMFSMLQVGILFKRHTNIYNTLAASIALLMLFNPFIITEIGFRLSYAAVLGIVYLHPIISSQLLIVDVRRRPKAQNVNEKIFSFIQYDLCGFIRYKVPDFFWQITAVSLAAQIATFPIGLYYFHQFPVMFLVSNWLVIPISNLILFSGTALFAVADIMYLGDAVGWCFNALITATNFLIFKVDSLPYALIESISISMIELGLIYLLIALLCLLYETKSAKALLAFLAVVLILSSLFVFEIVQRDNQRIFAVYHVPRQSAIAFIEKSRCSTLFDEKLKSNYSAMLFHIKHHWWSCGVKHHTDTPAFVDVLIGKWITFNGKSILLIDSPLPDWKNFPTQKLQADYVVLSHSPKLYINKLLNYVDTRLVIFDTSNKDWRVKYWKTDCEKLNLNYWNVADKGAFVADL